MGAPNSVDPYLALVASQHRDKPEFIAMLTTILQGMTDALGLAQALPSYFDLDTAVGAQLDICGMWIGKTRILEVPISNVYFTWDTADVGWDQGIWYSPGGNVDNVIILPDAQYRTLLRVWAAGNLWDGTLPGMYAVWDPIFTPLGFHLEVTDNQDMTIDLTLVGTQPDVLTLTLYHQGYFDLQPAAVTIAAHN